MTTVLRGAQVFDGERLTKGRTIVVDGAMIGGAEREVDVVDLVDLDGATLLPGLVDTHQHLVFDGQGSFEEQVTPHDDETLRDRAHVHARQVLAAGITTLRDLGDRGYVTLAVRGRDDIGTLLCAGLPITRVQGHCWYLGGEACRHRVRPCRRRRLDRPLHVHRRRGPEVDADRRPPRAADRGAGRRVDLDRPTPDHTEAAGVREGEHGDADRRGEGPAGPRCAGCASARMPASR